MIPGTFVAILLTSAVPVEHETLKLGQDGKTDDDDAGRTDVKVEIFMWIEM